MMLARRALGFGIIAALGAALALSQVYEATLPIDHPAIRYYQNPLDNPATRLAERLASGRDKLDFHADGLGYLPSLLERFGINPDSQALVFSKTSFQSGKISPRNPRAIYFTDDVAVGWVRGGDGFEIAALDPQQGIVFYTLSAQKSDHPDLARRDVCLKCHQGAATLGVPGIFIGSVFPGPSGLPDRSGAIITDHRTAFADRWGGWYVNAKRGEQPDRANAVAPDPAEPEILDTKGMQNLPSLIRKFDPAGYLTPVSDIVALMTFEHQTQMVNFMTRVNWEARIAAHDGKASPEMDSDIESIVAYMLFVDEVPLKEPVQGVSGFTRTFPQRGPRDHAGRSLRDFDLQTRLFRYPLSYMIYSAAFDALPENVRSRVYRRLYDVLTGQDAAPRFAALSSGERRSILEILRETKPDLPAYYR